MTSEEQSNILQQMFVDRMRIAVNALTAPGQVAAVSYYELRDDMIQIIAVRGWGPQGASLFANSEDMLRFAHDSIYKSMTQVLKRLEKEFEVNFDPPDGFKKLRWAYRDDGYIILIQTMPTLTMHQRAGQYAAKAEGYLKHADELRVYAGNINSNPHIARTVGPPVISS